MTVKRLIATFAAVLVPFAASASAQPQVRSDAVTTSNANDGKAAIAAASPLEDRPYAFSARARHLRSPALNHRDSLGEPAWMRALRIRSEALNRLHGLG